MHHYLRVALAAVALIALGSAGDTSAADQRWSITVCGSASDPRRPAVTEGVEFWNEQLASIRAALSLGPITTCERTVPDDLLRQLSEGVLNAGRSGRLPRELENVSGDVVVVLTGVDLISVGLPHAGGRRGLVILRRADIPPLSLPNVLRNVVAHELGHVLGLPHSSDPSLLMCGRPAPCRPAVFQSETKRFFPLTDAERRDLARRFR